MLIIKEETNYSHINHSQNVSLNKDKENYLQNNIKKLKKINYENSEERKFGSDINNITLEDRTCLNNLKIPWVPVYYSEYLKDILRGLKETEDYSQNYDYLLKFQHDINDVMRSILLDWIVDVHLKFGLLSETLFLTIHIIDRYLQKQKISRDKLQLVGITALQIASKYEEVCVPELTDLVYITDGAYTKAEIIMKESEILNVIEYNISFGSSLKFLELYNIMWNMDVELFMLSRYFLELFLVDYLMLKYKSSLLAAVAVYIALVITKREIEDSEIISLISNYNMKIIKRCAKDACEVIDKAEKSKLQAVRKKFSSEKYLQVSKLLDF